MAIGEYMRVLLRREGWRVNAKRVYRLYVEIGLQIRHKRAKAQGCRKTARSDRRCADGSQRGLGDGFHFPTNCSGWSQDPWCSTIVDAYSKVSPAIDVRDRYTGADVAATLTRVCRDHGCPRTIRVDNGPEFASPAISISRAYMNGVTLDFSRPGKPTGQ